MKVITRDMLEHFNNELDSLGCSFKYVFMNENEENPSIMRVLKTDKFVDVKGGSIINVTDDFYKFMDDFFMKNYGIKIRYNNMGSISWADYC